GFLSNASRHRSCNLSTALRVSEKRSKEADRGNNRKIAGSEQRTKEPSLYLLDGTDQAEFRPGDSAEERGPIDSCETHRSGAQRRQLCDQFGVDSACRHRNEDGEGRRIGNSQSVVELNGDTGCLQGLRNRGAATVNNDSWPAVSLQGRDVAEGGIVAAKRRTAHFDDDRTHLLLLLHQNRRHLAAPLPPAPFPRIAERGSVAWRF